jgi:hypothetical protein
MKYAKKPKYFCGPSGVYYSPNTNKIFLLEKQLGGSIINRDYEIIGDLYDVSYSKTKVFRRVAVEGHDETIVRLGDL